MYEHELMNYFTKLFIHVTVYFVYVVFKSQKHEEVSLPLNLLRTAHA